MVDGDGVGEMGYGTIPTMFCMIRSRPSSVRSVRPSRPSLQESLECLELSRAFAYAFAVLLSFEYG